jgi:hypothetical protein
MHEQELLAFSVATAELFLVTLPTKSKLLENIKDLQFVYKTDPLGRERIIAVATDLSQMTANTSIIDNLSSEQKLHQLS